MMSSFLTWVNESIIVILTAIECYERRLFGGRDNELSCDMMNLMFYLGCFWLQVATTKTTKSPYKQGENVLFNLVGSPCPS